MPSVRRYLLGWLLGALVLVGGLATVGAYQVAWEQFDRVRDHELVQVASSIARHGFWIDAAQATDAGGVDDAADPGQFVSQIWNRDGREVYASLPEGGPPRQRPGTLATVSWQGEAWRTYTLESEDWIIQVSHALSERQAMLAQTLWRILLPGTAMILLLAALIWWVVGRALAPLAYIRGELEQRAPLSLAAVPADGLPEEVMPMVAALNELLGRLDSAQAAQRVFVADAAHELRSPLTAVYLQAQIAERAQGEREKAEAMARLKAGVERAIHLVEQLLTMARLAPEAPHRMEPVDLIELSRAVLTQYAPLAESKRIDLGLAQAQALGVQGDAEGLRVMLGNLVDNAIRYTPEGGRVDVGIRSEAGRAVLEVCDTGPGIPPAERERVFDRFYRREGSVPGGSGLGLAIVRQVAGLHQAEVVLGAGEGGVGLRVSVRLPAASIG